MFSEASDWLKTTNWVDWIFVLAVLYGAIRGARRGLSRELGILIAALVALIAVRAGYGPLADLFPGSSPHTARLVSVVVIWTATMVVMCFLWKVLGSLMDFRFKGLVELLGGLVTGALRQAAVFSVVLLAAYSLVQVSSLQRAVYNNSRIGRTLQRPSVSIQSSPSRSLKYFPEAWEML